MRLQVENPQLYMPYAELLSDLLCKRTEVYVKKVIFQDAVLDMLYCPERHGSSGKIQSGAAFMLFTPLLCTESEERLDPGPETPDPAGETHHSLYSCHSINTNNYP